MSLQCWQTGLMPAIVIERLELPTTPWITLTEIVTVLVYGTPLCPQSLKVAASNAEPGARWRETGGAQILVQQLENLAGKKPPIKSFDEFENREQALRRKNVASWLKRVGLQPVEALLSVSSELRDYNLGVQKNSEIVRSAYTHLDALLTSGALKAFGLRNGTHEEIQATYFIADRWHDLLAILFVAGKSPRQILWKDS